MSDHRHRARWRLFYACAEHGPSVDRRHKRLWPTYRAENISVDRWPAKLQRAEYRKAMHDQDRKQYDAVNHLNHVNSLHSRIKAQYKRYRSVASKYINRYAALFRIQELYRKINVQEMIMSLLMKLRHLHTTFFIRQIRNEGIFNVTF